ncbi:MAG: PspA/IM30 family protein [Aquificae bacterium]|nr:PspA/IM30 family protein [Aquificota bacterium]
MGLLKRLVRILKAQAHATLDKLEDPIKITEEAIRELQEQIQKATEALAQVKANQIRLEREAHNELMRAKALQKRAEEILLLAKEGKIPLEEAEKKASELLEEATLREQNAKKLKEQAQKQKEAEIKLRAKIEELKLQLTKAQAELRTLKARLETARAVKKVNKQLSKIDPTETLSVLERMKEKVEEEEALAQAYEEITQPSTERQEPLAKEKLEELKRKLGLGT